MQLSQDQQQKQPIAIQPLVSLLLIPDSTTMLFRNRYLLFFVMAASVSEAFVAPRTARQPSVSAPALDAVPPMIIGPMIKKMREEKAKKNMPMADAEETAKEAPGLKVGKEVWKWPPIWPYDESFFKPAAATASLASQESLSNMASMISGVAQVPAVDEEASKFDPLKYWGEDQAITPTNLDPEAIEKLRAHYSFYLKDGISILEFGAAEDSYLPGDFAPSRHVGVGASEKLMESNPSLTERLVVDLNKVVKDRDVDNDDLRRLAQEPFDAIIMANTVDYLAYPREVFRSAWYLLKPGGIMIVAFSGKDATKEKFADAQTKMWRDYNDDQHLWITGSFFQFSAGDGWESLLGFDISPESAKKANNNLVESLLDRGKANNMYVVQAKKGYQDEGIDPENIERSIGSLCWMLPVLEERDKSLLLPRLARAYETTVDERVHQAIERNIPVLPIIYEALIKMDTFAFTFSMQAQLATDLISDPDFKASDEQILALKQGLGLRTPSKEFWVPIGQNTANMDIEERISLLGYIVPRFGSGDAAQEEALQAFVTGLQPTYAVIKSKCPELAAADVELLGTDLLAAEVLTVGRSTREEFASWLAALDGDELREIVSNRKSIRVTAKQELAEFKQQKAEEKARIEEYRRTYDEQIQTARTERSLVFNPKTKKMQLLDNKNKRK
jgi:SAM-dependent methyltransferase